MNLSDIEGAQSFLLQELSLSDNSFDLFDLPRPLSISLSPSEAEEEDAAAAA